MKGDDKPPLATLGKRLNLVRQLRRTGNRAAECRGKKNGWRLSFGAGTFAAIHILEQRIKFGPTGLGDRKMSQFLRQSLKFFSVFFRVGTIEVKPAANSVMVALILVFVTALISGHAMEHFYFYARKKIRHPIARHKGCFSSVGLNLFRRLQSFLIRLQWSG